MLLFFVQNSWNPSYGILESQNSLEPNITRHFLHEVFTLYPLTHTTHDHVLITKKLVSHDHELIKGLNCLLVNTFIHMIITLSKDDPINFHK